MLWTIPVILLVILFTFVLVRQIKGNPFRKTERAVPAAIQANLDRKFHLKDPWYEQYANYVKGVFSFDLGPSLVLRNQSVNDIVKSHFPVSLELGAYAFIFAIIVGVPLGVLAALRANKPTDYIAMLVANAGFAVPSFLVATLLIYYFAVKWDVGVPTSGWTTWQSKILPSIALGFFPMAYFARLVRGTMLETLQQDYVRTARAKGLRRQRIVGLHVLRNSLIPVVTAAGPLLGAVITGSFIIETIFSVPGIGRFYVSAISQRDYSLLMAMTILYAFTVAFLNVVVDVLYAYIDPRIRYS